MRPTLKKKKQCNQQQVRPELAVCRLFLCLTNVRFHCLCLRLQTNGHAQTPTEENGTAAADGVEEKLNGNAAEHEVSIGWEQK